MTLFVEKQLCRQGTTHETAPLLTESSWQRVPHPSSCTRSVPSVLPTNYHHGRHCWLLQHRSGLLWLRGDVLQHMRKPRSVWAGLTWAVRCGGERSACGCSAGEGEPQDQPVTWTAWRDLCALILLGKCGKSRYFMAGISLSSYVFPRESEIHSFREIRRCVGWEGLAMRYCPPALSIHRQKTMHPDPKGCILAGTCARLVFHSNAIEN